MQIRIYTMTHKMFDVPADTMYHPLQVGKAVNDDLGYDGDDTGKSISKWNCYFSELTGFYWIWKNSRGFDYVGTCHYRRYLLNEQEKIMTKEEYERLLSEYDLITTKRVKLNNSYYDGFSANHNQKALDMTGTVIKELYPEYYETFIHLVNGTETYFGNILVTSKKKFDAYARWLFTVFFVVAERIELETGEDAYHKRVFGFISEFLLLVWVRVNNLKVYECKVGMIGEKVETHEMKEQLAAFFAKRDIEGAKKYFLERKRERPDVLMEASDVTGELHLAMQIIATAGKEQETDGKNILERENRFGELIKLFEGLNQVVYHYRNGLEGNEDIRFLEENEFSNTAVYVAVTIQKDAQAEKENILKKIFMDRKAFCEKREKSRFTE